MTDLSAEVGSLNSPADDESPKFLPNEPPTKRTSLSLELKNRPQVGTTSNTASGASATGAPIPGKSETIAPRNNVDVGNSDLPSCLECKSPIVGAADGFSKSRAKRSAKRATTINSVRSVRIVGELLQSVASRLWAQHGIQNTSFAVSAAGSFRLAQDFWKRMGRVCFALSPHNVFDSDSSFCIRMAYCEEDYFMLFAMKCAGCKQGLIGEYVSACGKEYHPGCFVCAECKNPFPTGIFFEQD
ncbi:hypothetical protein HK104_005457, partial [Borealophlyctis nickersoniae]